MPKRAFVVLVQPQASSSSKYRALDSPSLWRKISFVSRRTGRVMPLKRTTSAGPRSGESYVYPQPLPLNLKHENPQNRSLRQSCTLPPRLKAGGSYRLLAMFCLDRLRVSRTTVWRLGTVTA